MSPRKLTEDDKQTILQLYRNSEATTSTLATSYGVSSSTISRFLKNRLSQVEYEELIQQKRLARTPRGNKTATSAAKKTPSSQKSEPETEKIVSQNNSEITPKSPEPELPRRRRRRSSVAVENLIAAEITSDDKAKEELVIQKKLFTEPGNLKKSDRLLEEIEEEEIDDRVDVITLGEMLGEDLADIDEDDEDDEDDEWESETESQIAYPHADSSNFDIQILPLSAAPCPKICYLVIDRTAELIVKPLAEFADLGSIPEEEIKQKTLPVFDNHRIAKRFSHRREKVIKVPDGRILHKAAPYLQAKGITRLLIDGQIYSLPMDM